MQHHRHSCIQQIQDVYHSNRGLPTETSQEANVWSTQSKWAEGAEEVFPDLSQVKLSRTVHSERHFTFIQQLQMLPT